MDNKRSVLNSFDSFNDAGLKNVDKVSYQSFNLIIGENGAGKTRFLKSLLNEMKKTNNYRVITMFFPDLLDVKGDMENDEEADYIFDLLQGNTDVDFRDFLRIIESAPDKESFWEDFRSRIKMNARIERERAEKSLNDINDLMVQLLNRTVELDSEMIYIKKRIGNEIRKVDIKDAFLFPEMSPGEKILFYFCLFLYYVQNNEKELVIIIDEPECHLHPKKLLELVRRLKKFENVREIWIASHSLYLVPLFKFEEIVLIENSEIINRNSLMYNKIYNTLLGEKDIDVFEFIKSVDSWMYYQWIVEMFYLPQSIGTINSKDEQYLLIRDYCLKQIEANSKIKMLDYGAGKCRIYDCLKINGEMINGNIEYEAFEPKPEDNYEYDENIRLYSRADEIMDNRYNIIILLNVLHEIPVTEWRDVFKKIGAALVEDGKLIFIEVKNLSHGEQPYGDNGFLILNDEAVSICFPKAQKISMDNQKSNAWVINKSSLNNIDSVDIINAIERLQESCKKELYNVYHERINIAREENKIDVSMKARKYAFISQQYINSKFAIDILKESKISREVSKESHKKMKTSITPPPINRKDKI